jgi:nitrogen-specific signal transduction histidine kinase
MGSTFADGTDERDAAIAILDSLETAVLVVAASSALRGANKAAEVLLDAGDGFGLNDRRLALAAAAPRERPCSPRGYGEAA